jgi:CheY-like chemotaxis protein
MRTRTVLVVDDEADIRASLELLLPYHGFEVATAANGQAALDYLRTHEPPCVILLDLRMPIMGGVQFRREQQLDPHLMSIPTIVCTAEYELPAGLEGVQAVCRKGSDVMCLIHLLQKYGCEEEAAAPV